MQSDAGMEIYGGVSQICSKMPYGENKPDANQYQLSVVGGWLNAHTAYSVNADHDLH